jgi:hypothetical protein
VACGIAENARAEEAECWLAVCKQAWGIEAPLSVSTLSLDNSPLIITRKLVSRFVFLKRRQVSVANDVLLNDSVSNRHMHVA